MNKKQQGFALSLELLAVIAIAAIILPIIVSANLGSKRDQLSALADELHLISIAAQNYYSEFSNFPDYQNSCIDALNALSTATNSFIRGIDNLSPLGSSYQTSCTGTNTLAAQSFHISLFVDEKSAKIIANKVAGATNTANIITTNTPVPSYMPALSSFLALDASGSFDARGVTITNVLEIVMPSGTLSALLKNNKAEFYTVTHNETVIKPNCLDGTNPLINLALVGLVATNTKIPYPNPPYIDNLATHDVDGFWRIGIDVYTEDGLTQAVTGTYALAIASCG